MQKKPNYKVVEYPADWLFQGCEFDFHFVDETTAEVGLNDNVYRLKKQ